MGRPSGVVGRSQLKQDDLVRIQTLSRDARMGPSEIRRVTGYSIHQIKYALKKKTPTVGKRSGRPRKGELAPRKQKAAEAAAAAAENGNGNGNGNGAGDGQGGQLDPPVSQGAGVVAGEGEEGSGELDAEPTSQEPGQPGQQEFGLLDGRQQQQQQQQQQQHVADQIQQQQQYEDHQQAQQPDQLQQQERQQTQSDQDDQADEPDEP
ncbi:hypothetical protein VTH06DRAFT_5244 [Thermothelomyces fergusii]